MGGSALPAPCAVRASGPPQTGTPLTHVLAETAVESPEGPQLGSVQPKASSLFLISKCPFPSRYFVPSIGDVNVNFQQQQHECPLATPRFNPRRSPGGLLPRTAHPAVPDRSRYLLFSFLYRTDTQALQRRPVQFCSFLNRMCTQSRVLCSQRLICAAGAAAGHLLEGSGGPPRRTAARASLHPAGEVQIQGRAEVTPALEL